MECRRQWPNRPIVVSLSVKQSARLLRSSINLLRTFDTLSGFFRHTIGASIVVDLTWATMLSAELTPQVPPSGAKAPTTLPLLCPRLVGCATVEAVPELLPHLCPVRPLGIAGSVLKRLQIAGALHVVRCPSGSFPPRYPTDMAPGSPTPTASGGPDQKGAVSFVSTSVFRPQVGSSP